MKLSVKSTELITMKLSQTEREFLAQTIATWCESKPPVCGVPLMYTDAEGEKCLLTHDQIRTLYQRLLWAQ